jgi:hypothetical protein
VFEGFFRFSSRLGDDDGVGSLPLYEGDRVARPGTNERSGSVYQGMDLACVSLVGIQMQAVEDLFSVDLEGKVVEDPHVTPVLR